MTSPKRRANARLSPSERADAREALNILDPLGLSLVEGAKIAAAIRPDSAPLAGWSIEDAINHFLARQAERLKKEEIAEKTMGYYDENLWFWADHVDAAEPIAEMDQSTLKESLDGILRSGTSIQTTWRAVRRLFRWCMDRKNPRVLHTDPTRGLVLDAQTGAPKREFYPVELVEKLFASPGKYFYAYVLMFFAGVRPWEIRGRDKDPLRFEHIVQGEYLRIPGAISKTGRKRGSHVVKAGDLLPAFWELWEGAPKAGVICPHAIRSAQEHAKKVMGLKRWVQDGARHTYATYDLAYRSDPGKTVLVLGHDEKPTMLNRHYMGNEITYKKKLYVATKERAERFMAIASAKAATVDR